MVLNREWRILLGGPALAADRNLRKRLSSDYVLATAECVERARDLMESGDIDVVLSEQQYPDGRGVEFLQGIRITQPNAIRILVLANARRDEIVKAINDAAVYQVISAPWDAEQISLILKRALEGRELARIHRYLSRELKFADSVLHRQNELITVKHLSSQIARSRPQPGPLRSAPTQGATLKETVEHLETVLVRQTLQRNHWNHTRAARELGLSRVGLANKIRRYGIERATPQEE